MARRAGTRGASRMRMSKITKRRTCARRRKPAKSQFQQRKRRRDDSSECELAIEKARDRKGKRVKPDQSIGSDTTISIATSQSLQEFSDETSAGPAASLTESPAGKQDNKQPNTRDKHDKGKTKRKSKKNKDRREVSGDSKTTTEKTPRKSSKNHAGSRRRCSSQKSEEQQQVSKGSESKPSESAGSGGVNKNTEGIEQHKGEAKDSKEPNDKAANPKETVVEEHVEEDSSSSSG